MARDILSEYGPESNPPMAPRATSGGCTTARDVHNYSPPQGPSNIGDSKSPGLHGNNFGNAGSQGKSSLRTGEAGRPGIGGSNKGHGTNR